MNNTLFYSLVMLLAGFGIPIMAALNGSLGSKLQNPALATTILFSVGLILSSIYLLATEGLPSKIYLPDVKWYFYCGGALVVFYVLSVTWIAPRFGISNAIAFVLLGQLIAMSLIDHFGWFGLPKYILTSQRVIGLVLMAVGVVMVLNKSSKLGF